MLTNGSIFNGYHNDYTTGTEKLNWFDVKWLSKINSKINSKKYFEKFYHHLRKYEINNNSYSTLH